ncbi:MAG: methionine ABC transporter permease [Lachnospirales bacterium]
MNNEYISNVFDILVPATIDTIYMVVIATVIATLIGFVLGAILYFTQKDGLIPNYGTLNFILNSIVNIGRSIPFAILILALFPLSSLVVGTRIGRDAAIVPLTISAIPFIARLVEASFNEISKGVIEVAITSGANIPQILFKVLLPETIHSQVLNITNLCISIIGYSAMAGTVGGGGLGDVALRYGFQRSQNDMMIYPIIILVFFVYLVQNLGTHFSKKLSKI